MKKNLMLIMTVLTLGALALPAQTTTTNTPTLPPPGDTLLEFFGADSTNWYIAPYGIYDTDTESIGAGLGLAYALADSAIMPTLRGEWLNETIWMVSGSVEISPPRRMLGKFPVRPLISAGIATPISGKGALNGDPVGLFGAGASVKITRNIGLVYVCEKRVGADFDGLQHRGGIWFNFP